MSDVPPPTNAFEKMMAAARGATATPAVVADEEDVNEPVLHGGAVRGAWLEHADPEEPLWRVPYFGQVVRVGTAEAVFKMRKREHETEAAREDKDLGFHAVIDMFGADAIAWRIVSSESGPRIAMQGWPTPRRSGSSTSTVACCATWTQSWTQTLNLTKGGQGDAARVWAGIDARRRRALNRFKAAMEAYVRGARLGARAARVR